MQLTMVLPIELPVLCNLACRLLVMVLVRLARVKKLSVPVPVPRRSAPAVMPEAEVEDKVLSPIPNVAHQLEVSPLVAVDSGDRTLSLDPGPCGTKAGRQALARPVVSLSSSCVMFACFGVIAIQVKTPTPTAAARARLRRNNGEGEPDCRAEERLPQVEGPGLIVVCCPDLGEPAQGLDLQCPGLGVIMRRLQGSHFIAKGRVLYCCVVCLCTAERHLLREAGVRRVAPSVKEGAPVGADLTRQFPLGGNTGLP